MNYVNTQICTNYNSGENNIPALKRQGQERFQKSCTNIGKKFFGRISAIHIYDRSIPRGELMCKDTSHTALLLGQMGA